MNLDRIELWCPGPSLVPHEPTTDWVVTVNRATLALQPWRWRVRGGGVRHWAVVHDAEMAIQLAREWSVPPDCMLVDAGSLFEVAAHMPEIMLYPHSLLKLRADASALRLKFSKVEALMLCGSMGAREILVHGDDMSGTLDWDGKAAGKRRNDERWEAERHHTRLALDVLRERGVQVTWIGSEPMKVTKDWPISWDEATEGVVHHA